MIGALMAMAMLNPNQAYSEPLRPQFHFTAKTGWLNDPNGLVYFKGEYHLFFQHNPFGTQWGNMTWGHAVSKDLVHWTQLDEAIKPDSLGTIFSGSAVVDSHSTSVFGRGAMVCIYTAAGGTNDASKGQPFTQCLAYSNDGRTFLKYDANPILKHQVDENRDPKVNWYEPEKKWIMALYLTADKYALFGSKDLRDWAKLSEVVIPNASECPDFYEIPLDGNRHKTKWVFSGASGYYEVGSFDGTTFRPETGSIRSNYGNTGYAAQTYFNDPKGRRVQIAWFNNSNFPDCAWNQQMGFPNELRLVTTPEGPRLTFQPVDEIKKLREKKLASKDGEWYPCDSGLMDIDATFDIPASGKLSLLVDGREVSYDAATSTLESFGNKCPIALQDGKLQLRILADRNSTEIYGQHGLAYLPIFLLPDIGGPKGLRISGSKPSRIEAFELRTAWAKD